MDGDEFGDPAFLSLSKEERTAIATKIKLMGDAGIQNPILRDFFVQWCAKNWLEQADLDYLGARGLLP